MKIWVANKDMKPIINWNSSLVLTNSKFSFGNRVYVNENGYVQRRITEDFMGWFIKKGENITLRENMLLLSKLEKKLYDNFLIGKD